MLKRAYFLGLASLIAAPLHLLPHHPIQLDWSHFGLFAAAILCAVIGCLRGP